jgi:hypothetical protein
MSATWVERRKGRDSGLGGAGGPRSSIGNPDRKRLTLTLYPLGHTRRHSAPDLRESPRTAVFLTGNGLFPGPGGLATQETRVFGAVRLPRGLDMKSLMDTPRRPYHRKQNLPNALRAAARAILDEAGPDVVGLRETARRVGVSATAAYRHFTNKEDLLASIAAEGFRGHCRINRFYWPLLASEQESDSTNPMG